MEDLLEPYLEDFYLDKNEFLPLLIECKAVIAGSFPLSLYLKSRGLPSFEPKDIDIFISPYGCLKKLTEYLEDECYYKIDHSLVADDCSYQHASEIYYFEGKGGEMIQIIVTKICPYKTIKDFDLTCCQAFIENNLGEVFHLDKRIDKMETRYTRLENIVPSDSEKRFEKYLGRGFKFFSGEKDITEELKTNKKNIFDFLRKRDSSKDNISDTIGDGELLLERELYAFCKIGEDTFRLEKL